MDQNIDSPASLPSYACEEAVAAYRNHGRQIQTLAIRKVLESVIRQKSEHVAVLRPLDGLCTSSAPRLAFPADAAPADVLRGLVTHEKAFAEAMDRFSASLGDDESRQAVKAIADAGRKFSSWAQDHLDLLAMF